MTDLPTRLDVHELLSAGDFVRRLAQSLVFDAQRGEDLAQDAWLAAAQQPPRHAGAAANWFRTTLANLARRRERDDARRRRRELAAARPEALPSAADVLAREQQRREVVDAVLALPEPYRGAVLARFFDDLEPAEIARRRGVPAATVRSWLHRGLEMLRQRLDERHGSRERWCTALLPLLRPARTTGMGLVPLAGALLMTKVLTLGAALCVAVLGLLWWQGDVPVPAPPTAAAANGDAAVASAQVDGAARPEAGAERRVAVAPPAADEREAAASRAGLRGRVVHPDGRPAPDCLVRALGIDGIALFAEAPSSGARGTLSLTRGEARTDERGEFTIAGLAPRTRYAVHADADGPQRTLRLCDVTPAPGAVADLGEFVLEAKGSVVGRVVDAAGAAIAGAEVIALDVPGVFADVLPLDRLDPRHGVMLAVPEPSPKLAQDPAAWRDRLRTHLGRELFVRTDLGRRHPVRTLVVEELPWLAAIWSELPVARATSAADGAFVLHGVEPGANLVIVRKAGLAASTRPGVAVRENQTADLGEIRLDEGEELRGVVTDAGGDRVAGAEVRVGSIGTLGFRGIAFCGPPTKTGADGTVAVPGLGRGQAMVAVRRAAGDPWHVTGPVGTGDDVAIALPARSEVLVEVEGPRGGAPVGLRVEVFEGPHLHELQRAGLQQLLAAQPREVGAAGGAGAGAADAEAASVEAANGATTLSLGALPPGAYTVRVEADDAVPVVAMLVAPQQEPLRIRLQPTAPLLVRVRDAAGRPVAGARVFVQRQDPVARNALPGSYGLPRWDFVPEPLGSPDAAGELRGAAPAEGGFLHATHARHAPASLLLSGGEPTADLVLAESGRLAGRLFAGGVPADPARWTVVAVPREIAGNVPLPELRVRLAPDGTFAIDAMAPAVYDVSALPIDARALSMQRLVGAVRELTEWSVLDGQSPEHEVEVTAGATAVLEFDLDPNQPKPGELPARLTGRALVDGVPLAGALLQRRVDEWSWLTIATVAADGSFAAPAVPPGESSLRLCRGAWMADLWAGEVTLASGEARVLDLALATGSVRGTATFASGLSPEGHEVIAVARIAGGAVMRQATVDALGRFAFAALPAGDYEIHVRGREGKCDPVPVHVVAGAEAAPLRLALREVTVLAGRIEAAPDGAMVSLRREGMWMAIGLEPGGRFHFSDLPPQVHDLSLLVDGEERALVPARFDLGLGSQRDLVLRLAAPK